MLPFKDQIEATHFLSCSTKGLNSESFPTRVSPKSFTNSGIEDETTYFYSLFSQIKLKLEFKQETKKVDRPILAWLFTLEGCFILENFLLSDESQRNHNDNQGWNLNPVFKRNKSSLVNLIILTDLVILENQVLMSVEMQEN